MITSSHFRLRPTLFAEISTKQENSARRLMSGGRLACSLVTVGWRGEFSCIPLNLPFQCSQN
ncbi:hypothetical protein BT93_H3831 [Corymbia citriodora subsp. variegata]|nr:hypothetical protein BT93_H3831 [Corymbia citriodora subsp. variegata]